MNPNIISNHFAHLFSFYVLFSEGGLNGSFPCFLNVCIYILVNRSKFEKKKQRSLEYHPMTYIGKRKYTSWFGGLKLPYNHTTYDDNCSRGDKKFRDRIFPPPQQSEGFVLFKYLTHIGFVNLTLTCEAISLTRYVELVKRFFTLGENFILNFWFSWGRIW